MRLRCLGGWGLALGFELGGGNGDGEWQTFDLEVVSARHTGQVVEGLVAPLHGVSYGALSLAGALSLLLRALRASLCRGSGDRALCHAL